MNYWTHFKANALVALKSLNSFIWHLAHAFIPCRFTSHEYWKINFTR